MNQPGLRIFVDETHAMIGSGEGIHAVLSDARKWSISADGTFKPFPDDLDSPPDSSQADF